MDKLLSTNCLEKYSIENRNCLGDDGTAYINIQKAVDSLKASDSLQIREGIYREQVSLSSVIPAQKTSIKISSYPNETVVINAADEFLNWTKCQSKIDCQGNQNWKYVYYTTPGFEIKQLFQHGKKLGPSRYPDKGWLYPSHNTINHQSEIMDLSLVKPNSYFKEAIVNIKTTPYWISNISVKDNYSNGRVLLEKNIEDFKGKISKKYGYYFTNIVEEINQVGEWAYDEASKKLFFWPSGDSSNVDLVNIEASRREYGFRVSNSKYVEINNLTVKYPIAYGIWVHGSDHVIIDSVEIDNSYTFGIFVQGEFSRRGTANYNRISNNIVKYSNYRGITSDSAADFIQITGNYVYATGAETFGDDLNNGVGHGIFAHGANAKILNNRIDKTGYTSIYLSGSQRTNKEVAYNHITNSNLSLNDGGGIYAGGRSNSGKVDLIHHNIIENVYGYIGGIKKHSKCDLVLDPKKCSKDSHGIYIDEQGNDFVIRDNTIINSKGAGIYYHWAKDNIAENNILYGNQVQLWLSGKDEPKFRLSGNRFSNNTLFSTAKNQKNIFYGINYNGFNFGSSNNNYYSNFYNERNIFSSRYIRNGKKIKIEDEYLTLLDWKRLSGKDLNSKEVTSSYITRNKSNSNSSDSFILVNTSIHDKSYTLENAYCDFKGETVLGNIKLQPFSSKILLKCFCNNDRVCNNKENTNTCPEECL